MTQRDRGKRGGGQDGQEGRIAYQSPKPQHRPVSSTPSPLYTKSAHLKRDQEALRGLTWIKADRGPLKRWLWVIGRAEDDKCECGVAQSAAHLLECPLVGDGR